jgi:alanyl-tRNA synthetase
MIKSTAEVRQAFLDFFATKQHQIVKSSSLVPGNDATLLFTNAGMVPFKDVFLGAEKRSYTRATSAQRCVRAGGKHNDLENVGYTARHHTFFEMMGNFSFGDYFKNDAISYAWEFLTGELGIPKEKLLVTIYDTDEEAFSYWKDEIGVPEDKIIRIGDKSANKKYESDNFWSMGDTGPCGPCSEIFYDHGEDIFGGPPGSPDEDGDRFIEIWNIVFMQFNRQSDGSMEPLPNPSIDTGMGLERISAIMQNVHSNYEIDIFQALIKDTAALLDCSDLEHKSLRVISDHIRSCSFLIVDGVVPSNEGRGYVLRRIIRRAIRHGHKLEATGHFFHKLVASLIAQMGEAYPELLQQQAIIEKLLRIEEEQFGRTLDRGMILLEDILANLSGDIIKGDDVFKLYDTYGFPADLTADIARERHLKIDRDGFDAAMKQQRERA